MKITGYSAVLRLTICTLLYCCHAVEQKCAAGEQCPEARELASAGPVTPAELAKHKSAEDCWVAVHGKVYVVTDFLRKHPGGRSALLQSAGKDSTKLFEQVGHHKRYLKRFKTVFEYNPDG